MSALVAFFSAGGVTARVAERLASAINAPVYEIRPAAPYTAADLDWRNQASRSSVEMNDKASRPAIADADAPIADADVVYIGYPVWWYREPSIIDTFVEAYDFRGKKIALFATSGSSDIGQEAGSRIEALTGAKVVKARRFAANASASELKAWAEE